MNYNVIKERVVFFLTINPLFKNIITLLLLGAFFVYMSLLEAADVEQHSVLVDMYKVRTVEAKAIGSILDEYLD